MSLCQAPADVLQISLWQFDRWDFLAENFFSYFNLDPNCLLSDDVKQYLCLTFKLCVFFLIVLRQFTVDGRPVYSWQIIQFHVLGNCSAAEIQEVPLEICWNISRLPAILYHGLENHYSWDVNYSQTITCLMNTSSLMTLGGSRIKSRKS